MADDGTVTSGGAASRAPKRLKGRDPAEPRRWYGRATEDEILRRVAAGETLHGVCASPELPAYQVVCGWVKGRAGFGARLDAARRAAGRPFRAPLTGYCEATFEAILERLADGEGMVSICADPAMPHSRTVYRWLQARADLREAVALAREIQGDRLAEAGLDEARAATPATARLTEVRLRHIRWYAARLAPMKYQTSKAVPAWQAAGWEAEFEPQEQVLQVRRFWVEHRDDGWRRVRGSHVDPDTRQIVDEPGGEWTPPPIGMEEWNRRQLAAKQAREAKRVSGPGDDPEGWT